MSEHGNNSTTVPFDSLDDNALIQLYLKEQDNRYFRPIYQRYAGKVYHKCLSILKEEVLSRDAVQDIFLKVIINLSAFNAKSRFSTWLYSITYNYCIDQIRKSKSPVLNIETELDSVNKLQNENDVPASELLELKVDQLRTILNNLTVTDRLVLLMKYQDNFSIKEIAEVIQKSENAVKMMLKRAKERALKIKSQIIAEAE